MNKADLNSAIDDYIRGKHYRQINSLLLWQDGEILARRYYNGFTESSRNVIKSVAKSIMSICAGIALDQGLIQGLDEPICRYLPQFNQGRDPLHRAITLRHLLTMSSGIYFNGGVHYHCPMLTQMRRSDDWISHISDCAVTDLPGTKYNYKEWDVLLLAGLLNRACGDMYDFLDQNLYQPLGIESKRWYQSPCGVYYSVAEGDEGTQESLANLTAADMQKIGQLFLEKGHYNGKPIVSEEYIAQAVAPSKCNPGYGFLWWLGEGWYGCRGFGGQNITVFPEKNTIFVMQATPTSRGMGYDDVLWKCLDFIKP
ncbi:CubicO group peptidase (beta-lactamase class C family) [Anaerotaenia torta]|uniref:serine hydrolase domain-containing protein n=1 Tax=Anaerotaenia torta TaxID=433293 RepID=UPI003D1DB113